LNVFVIDFTVTCVILDLIVVVFCVKRLLPVVLWVADVTNFVVFCMDFVTLNLFVARNGLFAVLFLDNLRVFTFEVKDLLLRFFMVFFDVDFMRNFLVAPALFREATVTDPKRDFLAPGFLCGRLSRPGVRARLRDFVVFCAFKKRTARSTTGSGFTAASIWSLRRRDDPLPALDTLSGAMIV
jgi:hypothetical protein